MQIKLEHGFSLVELLVTVAILGILASMAIPIFAEYRAKAHDAAAISDLMMIKSGQEAYRINHPTYLNCLLGGICGGLPGVPALSPSVGALTQGSANGYSIWTCSWKGSVISVDSAVRVRQNTYYSPGYTSFPLNEGKIIQSDIPESYCKDYAAQWLP